MTHSNKIIRNIATEYNKSNVKMKKHHVDYNYVHSCHPSVGPVSRLNFVPNILRKVSCFQTKPINQSCRSPRRRKKKLNVPLRIFVACMLQEL
jgi:hypothetical protein